VSICNHSLDKNIYLNMQAGTSQKLDHSLNYLQDELSWANDAEAEILNCRAAPVDMDTVPKQQHVGADHHQECSPDVQQPAPDEQEAQHPGQQVQQHDPAQPPQQQRTALRHDAPSWDTRACAGPITGEQACMLAEMLWWQDH
jgi:type IV secretory pathway VirB10-like protein